jgi:hypothetical protein
MDGYPPPTSNVFFRGEFEGGVGFVEEVLGLFDWLTNTSDQTSNTSNRQIVVLPWVLSPPSRPPAPQIQPKKEKKSGPFACMLSHLLGCVNYHIFVTLFIIIFWAY